MAAKPRIMSSPVGTTTDPWSVREKLCLASSVMRSGDQNWVSVSRAIKPFAEPLRQQDFFSQRNCARQYSTMLENVETPKRKRSSERGDVVETPGDLIVRKMAMERMDELKAQIREDKARFKQLKKEIDEIRSGTLDDKLQSMWEDIQSKKKTTKSDESETPKSAVIETGKPLKSTSSNPIASKARRPQSRPSKPSRTSEGSTGEPSGVDTFTKQSEDCDLDSVFDHPSTTSTSDVLPSNLPADKHKSISQRQKQGSNSSSVGGTEGSDVDVTAISDVAKSLAAGSPTLSKLLTPRGKSTPSTSSISPGDAPVPHQPLLSAAAKATAAKEAAKILLGGVTGGGGGDESMEDDKQTDKKSTADKTSDKTSDKSSEKASDKSVDKSGKGKMMPKASGGGKIKQSVEEKETQGIVCKLGTSEETKDVQVDDTTVKPDEKTKIGGSPKMRPVTASSVGSNIRKIKEVAAHSSQEKRPRGRPPKLKPKTTDNEEMDIDKSHDGAKTISIVDVVKLNKRDATKITSPTRRKQEVKTDSSLDKEDKEEIACPKSAALNVDDQSANEDGPKTNSPQMETKELKDKAIKGEIKETKEKANQGETKEPMEKANKGETKESKEKANKSETKDPKEKENKGEKPTSHVSSKKQDTPKIDVEICDIHKSLDAAEDSDNSQIPTEPSSPSRPDATEVRGKKKSRGRPPSSARRSGRSKARVHADGDDTSEERRHSESFPPDDETRSETADSEDRPSESDREDASSVVTGSLQQSMFVDSMPGSPSSITAEHEHDHTYRIWRKAIMLVWRTIASHKYANIFLHPVTNDIAPGYEGIVHRPINLTRIKKNVENGTIRTTEQFHRDMLLMFQNAIMYNSRDHDVYRMASDMQNDAVQYIEEFMSTQLMVQQPDSVKMLRSKDGGSRRIDAGSMPSKDETEKPRRGSSEVETSGKKRRTRADEY